MRRYIWELIVLFILFVIVDAYTTFLNLDKGHGEANPVILLLYNNYGMGAVLFSKVFVFSYVFLFAYFTNNYHLMVRDKPIHFRIFWVTFFIIGLSAIAFVCISNITLYYTGYCPLDFFFT